MTDAELKRLTGIVKKTSRCFKSLKRLTVLVNEGFDPAEAENIIKRLLSHKNKETCVCMEKRINSTNTAQITALKSSNNALDALPTTWTWKIISELRHQTLHPTEPSPTHIPIRRTMGPVRVPFRQAKKTRAIMECRTHAQSSSTCNRNCLAWITKR